MFLTIKRSKELSYQFIYNFVFLFAIVEANKDYQSSSYFHPAKGSYYIGSNEYDANLIRCLKEIGEIKEKNSENYQHSYTTTTKNYKEKEEHIIKDVDSYERDFPPNYMPAFQYEKYQISDIIYPINNKKKIYKTPNDYYTDERVNDKKYEKKNYENKEEYSQHYNKNKGQYEENYAGYEQKQYKPVNSKEYYFDASNSKEYERKNKENYHSYKHYSKENKRHYTNREDYYLNEDYNFNERTPFDIYQTPFIPSQFTPNRMQVLSNQQILNNNIIPIQSPFKPNFPKPQLKSPKNPTQLETKNPISPNSTTTLCRFETNERCSSRAICKENKRLLDCSMPPNTPDMIFDIASQNCRSVMNIPECSRDSFCNGKSPGWYLIGGNCTRISYSCGLNLNKNKLLCINNLLINPLTKNECIKNVSGC